ncbi:PD-(D/E)XK nuclease family protein [Colwellia echini]|uniref:PD-(D/E)XK nuclease superfamily protein n=1 Tax=Colwellia echini TaxID=1982103 RepID=A0ABY3MXT6_9GAMM|nr:PD-(D/E)XK nuclease family protein [Colwellia echini]TYK66023.1 hypothetical protein CWS31_007045 [Colwellia echini]
MNNTDVMNTYNVREKYRELLNNIDFDKLELGLKQPNIFQILGIARAEIRHSNFLGWLLDPNESHGLGKLFLIKFLRGVSTSQVVTDLDEFDIEKLNFDTVEVRREWKNIDLLLIIEDSDDDKDLVVCIENKVDSKDHSGQLKTYRDVIDKNFNDKRKAFVYLTPSGEEPLVKAESEHYALYSYVEIVEQIESILTIHTESISQSVTRYIIDYIRTIRRELMQTDELNLLADKIYRNHRELIDFVFEHKTDLASTIYPVFEKKIIDSGWVMGSKNKGFARFLTPKLAGIIPKQGKGWTNKENFLFEINFNWAKNNAVFKAVISPSTEELQKIFIKAFEPIKGYKKAKGKQWLINFDYSWRWNIEDMVDVEHNDILNGLDEPWKEISKIVQAIENALLPHQEELEQFL